MNMPVVEKPQMLDLSPKTFDEAWRFCEIVTASGLAPKGFAGKPNDAFIAIQWGNEIGIKPMQSLQNIAVINGRPSLWGDAVLAVVLASPLCEDVIEYFEGTPNTDSYTAICIAKRKGKTDKIGKFSIADAKKAKLFTKEGPWTNYPDRMQQMRARGFSLRDQFSDVLKGIPIAEEVMDYEEREINPVSQTATRTNESLPPMDQAKFQQNFPTYEAGIQSGRKTADAVIAALQSKFTLTDEQAQSIRSIAAPIEGQAEVVSQ